jgi:hypothetical protein
MAAVAMGRAARSAHREDAVEPAVRVERRDELLHAVGHGLGGERAVLLLHDDGHVDVYGGGNIGVGDVGRPCGVEDAAVDGECVHPQPLEQVFHVAELFSLGVEGAEDRYRFRHEIVLLASRLEFGVTQRWGLG